MPQSPTTFVLRSFHSVAGALTRLGVKQADLSPDSLIAEAKRQTRLTDFGDDTWREPFQRLVMAYDADPMLGPVGRYAMRFNLIRMVSNRLQIQDAVQRDPEIRQQPIQRPVFVLGFLRTGTTWLHQLLSADPAARPLQAWEGAFPVPSPRPETYETDPRIAKIDKGLKQLDGLLPGLRAIHPIEARGPEECLPLLWATFMTPYCRGRAEPYREWLKTRPACEFHASYEYYKLQLQILQRYVHREHWTLKSPAHLAYVDSLLHVFPDAIVIHTHRDPQAVVPSWCSLTATLDQLFYAKVDPAEVGRRTLNILRDTLDRYREVRRALPSGRVIDVSYDALVADPRAVVEQIYQRSGMNYSATVDRAVRDRIERDRHGDRPKHRYTAEEFGLTAQKIHHELADYWDEFGEYCGHGVKSPLSRASTTVSMSIPTAELST